MSLMMGKPALGKPRPTTPESVSTERMDPARLARFARGLRSPLARRSPTHPTIVPRRPTGSAKPKIRNAMNGSASSRDAKYLGIVTPVFWYDDR